MMEDEIVETHHSGREYLVKLFNEFDHNGTGYLEKDQLRQTVSKITGRDFTDEEVDTLINKFDLDNDKKISLEEFLIGCNNNDLLKDDEELSSFTPLNNNNNTNSSINNNDNSVSNDNNNNNNNNSSDIGGNDKEVDQVEQSEDNIEDHDNSNNHINNNNNNNNENDNSNQQQQNQQDQEINNNINSDDIEEQIDQEKHLRFIFSLFDKDGDGLVSIEQLRSMLQDIKDKTVNENNGNDNGEEADDDDDINYIINTLSADGNQTISFDSFMKAIEQINSPQDSSFNIHNDQAHHHHHNDITGSPLHQDSTDLNDQPHSDTELEEANENSSISFNGGDHSNNNSTFSTGRPDSPFEKKSRSGSRSGRNSWVAPHSIVNMIKRRTDLYSKDQIEVFDSNENLTDKYKREAALLRTEKEHLGTKLQVFEGQLKEARESQEKLSEDNAQLKETVSSNKKTVVENQKLTLVNKKLQEEIEDFKQQLLTFEESKNELLKNQSRLKFDKEQMLIELQNREKDLLEKETQLKELQQQIQAEKNHHHLNSSSQQEQSEEQIVEAEQLRQENNDLKSTLIVENEKAQQTIKLLTEELNRLQKKSNGDRDLLESSNKMIHSLKTSLEEIQSKTASSFDPNYKLSLLSELEHQVATRLGTTPSFEQSPLHDAMLSTPISSPISIRTTQNGTPVNNSKNVLSESSDGDNILIHSDGDDDTATTANNNDINSEIIRENQEKIRDLEEKIEQLQKLNKEILEKNQENNDKLQSMVNELQDQKKQLNEQIITLEQSNQIGNQELLNSIESLKSTVNEKQKELDSVSEESKRQLEQFNTEKQQLLDSINKLNSEKQELQDSKSQKELHQSQLESREKELQAKQNEIEQLEGKLRDIEDQNDKLLKQVDTLEFDNTKLKSQQEVLAKSIETPSNLSDPINIKANQTQNELSQLKQRLDELSLKNNSLINENTQLKNSLTPVDSPTTSQRDIGSNNLIESATSPTLNNLVKATSIENLQNEISTLNELNSKLQKDIKRYELISSQPVVAPVNNSLIDELKKENEKLNERFRTLEYESLLVKEEIKASQSKNQTLVEKMESMKIEYENNIAQLQNNEKKSSKIMKEKLKRFEHDGEHAIEMKDDSKILRDKVEDLEQRLRDTINLNKHLQAQLNQNHSVNDDSDEQPLMGQKPKKRDCCLIC